MRNEGSLNHNSRISVESMKSKSSFSLGRPSWDRGDYSLSKKVSLVYVMSIESDRKSDVYDRMLQENSYQANHVNLWNRNSMENRHEKRQEDLTSQQQQRFSLEPRVSKHDCDCYRTCLSQECPCFQARDQACEIGKCCETCIQMKNALLMADRGDYCNCKNTHCLKSYCKCFQNNGACTSLCRCEDCQNKIDSPQRAEAILAMKTNQQEGERRSCTCKKTKCNKKYCSCFANNIKCTNLCQCEGCHNCDRHEMAMEEQSHPEFIEEEDLTDKQFPQRMSFEKIQFTKYS